MCCLYNVVCVVLQWSESSETQIMLRNMDFEASGMYCCEVSTQTPIYTKLSNDHELTVIRKCACGGSTESDGSCPVLLLRERVRCLPSYLPLYVCVQLQKSGIGESYWKQEMKCEVSIETHISCYNF